MPEFFIAIMLILMPDGRVSIETLPIQTRSECQKVIEEASAVAAAKFPGADVRVSCISTEQIGQLGV